MKANLSGRIAKLMSMLIIAAMMASFLGTLSFAESGKNVVTGKLYEFDESNEYKYSESDEYTLTDTENTYGEFSVKGDIAEIHSKNGVPAYRVDSGKLDFTYSYSDSLMNAEIDEWHLVEDKTKKIDIISLDEKIMRGAIVVQTSKDRNNWVTVASETNMFEETPVNTSSIYTTQDVQLINGCYYRVVVAYKLARRTEESSLLFINTDKYENKRLAEVYEFYACNDSAVEENVVEVQKYNLGSAVRVEHFDGYSGEKEMEKNDPHYNITLGQFFVSGYTDTAVDKQNNVVFLKNVGDKVTLWFNLKENIDAIGGNPAVTVTPDNKGFDQYFQTPPTDFGRGTLIIRYTDHNNISSEPQIYTNYLEANTAVGADTKVNLFEEGDYEVALDYEITEDKLIDSEGHYRIFFKFSIRNGNCMVYPFDLANGNELTNSSMSENGFYLDLARSRYLKVNVKREIMADSADGLVEDTRFNGPARDGAEYRDEGIYTITVTNQYTNQLTVKKIYVGTNRVMRAYMATGLSIPEINNLVSTGAAINDDGTIRMTSTSQTPIVKTNPDEIGNTETENAKDSLPKGILICIFIAVVVVGGIICVIVLKNKKNNTAVQTNETISAEENTSIESNGGNQE